MRTERVLMVLCMLILPAASSHAASPAEVARWVNSEAEPLAKSKNCVDLSRALTLVGAEQVLHAKYPHDFPDQGLRIAVITKALRTDCGGRGAAAIPQSSLGDPVRYIGSGGKGGGGATRMVPAMVLAVLHMSPEERRAFEAALPADEKQALATYLAANNDLTTEIAKEIGGKLMDERTEDLLKIPNLKKKTPTVIKPDVEKPSPHAP